MKIHPTQYSSHHKSLRRLPHIFEKVLELPFSSNTHVLIDETPHFLRFIVPTHHSFTPFNSNVRASTVEIHPGVKKIVIVGIGFVEGEFQLDVWRFRLPGSTLVELASAEYRDGELIVRVPKEGVHDQAHGGVVGPGQLLLVH